MNVLDKIIADKKAIVEAQKKMNSIDVFKDIPYYSRATISLKKNLARINDAGIIAEFKRQSPSKGLINTSNAQPADVAKKYEKAGVSAMSILTDTNFFGGSNGDLSKARAATQLPILRKEFIIDPYQVHEAKAIGADAILLIGAVLDKNEGQALCDVAKSLNLEVLYEVHDKSEIKKIPDNVDIVGVNNRDLKAFKVDFNYSKEVYDMLPADVIKISESGISNPATIADLHQKGFNGFLIGETFMKTEDPGKTCKEFIDQCNALLA